MEEEGKRGKEQERGKRGVGKRGVDRTLEH